MLETMITTTAFVRRISNHLSGISTSSERKLDAAVRISLRFRIEAPSPSDSQNTKTIIC
jgi:hypothetical protein